MNVRNESKHDSCLPRIPCTWLSCLEGGFGWTQPLGRIPYLRKWKERSSNFEVIVGKSMSTTGPVKCSGLAQQFDEKPKHELFSVLAGQGVGEGQVVVSVSGRRHERARNAHQSLGSGWYSGLWMFNTRLPRNHRTLRRSVELVPHD
jgi:hypothetical protein